MELAVLLKGTLRGLSIESGCDVLATRQPDLDSGSNTYCHLRMLRAPIDWPDGEYVIEFEGFRARALLRCGHWLIDEPVKQPAANKGKQGRRV